MHERILVPTDGSDVAVAAVEGGLDIGSRYGATGTSSTRRAGGVSP